MSDTSGTQFNVAQLLKSPVGTVREYGVEATVPSLAQDVQLVSAVVGKVRFTRLKSGILAQGHFQVDIELTCDRCLGLFSLPLEFDLEEQFAPVIDVSTGKWLEVEETDPALLIDAHHILDLEEVFRQAIYVSLPMHPVCRSDCRGLCPYCGRDLNEGPCDCTEDEMDPRWMALRNLKRE